MQPITNPVAKDAVLSFMGISMIVNVHTAVADVKNAVTHQACANPEHSLTRVRQTLACPECGNEDKESFVRVKEVSKALVLVQAEWLAEQAAEAAKFKQAMPITIHPAGQVAAALIPSGKTYYVTLTPGSHVERWKAYNLLVRLIGDRPELTFMTKLTFRTALQLFSLSVSDGTLILKAMADGDMVRERPAVEDTGVTEANLKFGQQLIDLSVQQFDVGEHGSTGREELARKIAAAAPAGTVTSITPAAGGEVLDVTAALEAMIKDKKAAKAPARKTAAKKTTTRTVRKAS